MCIAILGCETSKDKGVRSPPTTAEPMASAVLCAQQPSPLICGTHFAVQQLASSRLLGDQLQGNLLQDRGGQLFAVSRQEVPQQGLHLVCRTRERRGG